MAVQLRAACSASNWCVHLGKDTSECVEEFEKMRKEQPEYRLTDGCEEGYLILWRQWVWAT